MSTYTTDKLIASIKRRTYLPAPTQKTLNNTDILDLCNEELVTRITTYLTKGREEYLVFSQDFPLVAGDDSYRLPKRALWGKLRDLEYVDSQGNIFRLPRVEPDSPTFNNPSYASYGAPQAFYLESNSVILAPTPAQADGSLRMSYYMRPNRLVLPSQAGVIAEISGSVLTVNGPASGWDENDAYDLIKGTPGFEMVNIDQTPASFNSTGPGVYEFTFGTDVDLTELEVGDYICLAEESAIPMIPADLHPLLAQRIAVKILESLGDAKNIEIARRQLAEMEASLLPAVTNRVEGVRRSAVPAIRRWV